MTKAFHTMDDVMRSPLATFAKGEKAQTTDRVLRSTKLEDGIYADLRTDDEAMDEIEGAAGKRKRTSSTWSHGAVSRRRSPSILPKAAWLL